MNFTIENKDNERALIDGTAPGFMHVSADTVLIAAEQMKAAFPKVPRLIDITKNVLAGIDAAYKTASGLYSEKKKEITGSIYDMSKLDVAMTIVEHDATHAAFDRAAFEVARDAFVSGKIDERAAALAGASGRSVEVCARAINKKLSRMSDNLDAKTAKAKKKGEVAPSPEAIKEIILNEGGRYLIQLPTGEGKTSKIAEPVIAEYIKNKKKVVVISHRRSINANLCAGMDGMVSYDKVYHPEDMKKYSGLKAVVNSLSKATFNDFIYEADLVVIDEASQVISHVLGGEVKDREAVWDALNKVVTTARNVIFTDADINQYCVEMIGEARFFSKIQNHRDISIRTGGTDQVRGEIVRAAVDGKKVLVACDVAKEARALGKMIEKTTGREVLVITADNANWKDQAAFIADPNSDSHEIVIYSPVITSALSITKANFDSHFGLFAGQVAPSDAIQMLRRDRTSKAFTVGLKNPEYSKREQVEVDQRRHVAILAELVESGAISTETQKTITAELNGKEGSFSMARYKHCSDEAWLKDNIQNALPAMLMSQGFKIKVIEQDEETSREGFVVKSQGLKALKKDIAEKVKASVAADKKVAMRVRDAGSNSESEHFEVIRSRAEKVLGKKDLTEEDAKFWGEGEGEGKVKRFAKLIGEMSATENELRALDVLRPVVEEMMEHGCTAEDNAGTIDELQGVRTALLDLGVNLGRAGTDRAKQAAMTRILASFGLKTKRIDGGKAGYYYVITHESYDQVKGYIN